ncbi:hypothetical protein DICPUDRAFT_51090 [Dictyostelium purpureum]|uniref:tRNA (guanine(10)-N(2))-methyltransferase n=1 Tax=Dictyostelium purpureum TaxID=5786 RepID=F1A1Y4_DICPU|nr:uncharacterized protein DICPUDRAFT_51090 [Dictyostelium purpureum]EGC29790.1 hypothetical protein DICPUDRAFT_51090 [Dictyostelium purpureum]|eukprot:XP_003293676.1 hypothetical protein DICPUDRAFT_51090 [Dictyostelium purpureum]
MPKYLIQFVQQHPSFRIFELESVAKIFNINVEYNPNDLDVLESLDPSIESPFLYVNIPSDEDVKKICSRAVLIKQVISVWAENKNLKGILEDINSNYDKKFLSNYLVDKTYRIEVDGYGTKYTQPKKLEMMLKISESPLWDNGKVVMKPTDESNHIVWTIQTDFGVERQGMVRNDSLEPRIIFFGQRVARGNRDDIIRFNLQERKYLGTTSMDPELSLVSANMGLVKKGDFMLDPFVGTGSFIIVSSHFGAQTVGCDIDMKAMRKQEECNLETNFADYGLSSHLMGTVLCDNSCPPWRTIPMFDSIITDPPYGVRAGAKKVGYKDNRRNRDIPEECKVGHVPQYIEYKVPDVMADLLELAAKTLVIGGRLVYWLPTSPDYKETDLPRHPCLRLITASCLQILTNRWGRRLVIMEKTINYNDEIHHKSKLTQDDLGQIDPQHKDLRQIVFWKAMGSSEKSLRKEKKKENHKNIDYINERKKINNSDNNNNSNNNNENTDNTKII